MKTCWIKTLNTESFQLFRLVYISCSNKQDKLLYHSNLNNLRTLITSFCGAWRRCIILAFSIVILCRSKFGSSSYRSNDALGHYPFASTTLYKYWICYLFYSSTVQLPSLLDVSSQLYILYIHGLYFPDFASRASLSSALCNIQLYCRSLARQSKRSDHFTNEKAFSDPPFLRA